jgi:hypothetical protein
MEVRYQYSNSLSVEVMGVIFSSFPEDTGGSGFDYVIDVREHIAATITANDLVRFTLLNADKQYQLIGDGFSVIPNDVNRETLGKIDLVKNEILKYPPYHSKVVSFCLYGTTPMYLEGALRNAEAYASKYPDWKVYMYTRKDVPEYYINELTKRGAVIIPCVSIWGWLMMFMRFYPTENPSNVIYLSRDTDCRLTDRENIAIHQWINESTKTLHIMRDHPYHGTQILGGMWGLRNKSLLNLRLWVVDWVIQFLKSGRNLEKGPDQYFLRSVYQVLKEDAYVNDEFFRFESVRYPIKHPRSDFEYIGEPYDEHNKYNVELRDAFRKAVGRR